MAIKERRTKILLALYLLTNVDSEFIDFDEKTQKIFDLSLNQKTRGTISGLIKEGLIEKNNVLYPVEIKMKASISEQDFAGIEYFRKKYSRAKKGYVVCLSRKNTPFDRNNTIVSYEEIS